MLNFILISGGCALLYYIYLLYTDPLRDVPGPFAARFTRLWLFRDYASGKYQKTSIELHKILGPIVRVAPGQYSIDDPDAAKIIYGHGTEFLKSDWYKPWGDTNPQLGNLFQIQDPHHHSLLRRKTANAYAMSNLVSYEPHVDATTTELLQRLTEFSASGETFNMGHWFQCYAFEMIGKITFTKSLGFLAKGEDIGNIISTLDFGMSFASLNGIFPSLHKPIMGLIRTFNSTSSGPDAIWAFADDLLTSRSHEPETITGPSDFIKKLTAIQQKDPEKMSSQDIGIVVRQNIAAGSDTTSITLSATLYYLLQNPSTLAKLREELDTAVVEGKVSEPITFKEAQNLPYLQAVIKESLRIHPAIGFTMPRVVPKGGTTMLGRFFPAGTVVGVSAWVAHQNHAVFGNDAHLFRPERWLESKEKAPQREAYFFAFGQGARTCIGKNISLLEISKAIPQVVRHFDFELELGAAVNAAKEWTCLNRWFVKPMDFNVRVKKRATI